ncbi:DUF2970 domain-containing protein [Parashewanella spongiae]|uniref:DUF2970 domain-containing protein n=1 Tax=Parashewanella spongiae TaxID=342950 RepID=A0A3A6TLK3_9GAMM|nr:DUF2970 domain-containing protein [Parashewanella spongiae]MCL1078596.1 DUF2970 domain-containing protein [Parashewanella spongiae]RJY13104.1 DUF2970 domain-containing protein [Parashewanella spongiae]
MITKLWQVFSSTFAAFFGVQTENNRQRDFTTHSPISFIIMGIVMAIMLVGGLIMIVNLVLT